MNKLVFSIFIFVAPIQILAQDGSVPVTRVTDTPVAMPVATVSATPRPATTMVAPTPILTPRSSLELGPRQGSESQNLVFEQKDSLPEDWFYKYATILLGVGIATLLSYWALKFNKSKQNKNNKDQDDRCGNIRDLLEQKRKELEEMVKNWPEEKIKKMTQDKVLGELKKDEEIKKILDTAQALKDKRDRLNKIIEMLQKKYDLCMLEVPSSVKKYTMRIVEGALTRPDYLDKFSPKKLEYFDETWKNLLGVDLTIDEIKEVQKIMIKHYEGPEPWFMDGHALGDSDEIICAFGADDGEGGRVFKFRRDDKKAFQKAKEYALSKGIPEEQFDFVDF